MTAFEEKLEKYAELAVKQGINVQKGQTVIVSASISAVSFVHRVAKKAYQLGAKHVHFQWEDDELALLKYQYAPDEALQEYPKWEAKGMEELAKNGAAFLFIRTPSLDLFKDIAPEKIAMESKAKAEALEISRDYRMKHLVSWSIIEIPSKEWAVKIFPDTEPDVALDKLWEAIFKITRVDRDDPVKAWKEHKQKLKQKVHELNQKHYQKFHYRGPGTDLTIEFPKDYHWTGGGSKNEAGDDFIPNMPTEEVFTLPLKTGVNGTVKSTKPLNYGGTLIEDLSVTFKDGKIVDFNAEKGFDTLKRLIETDEGSHYLGEVALVPDQSPISQSGLVFYSTLFDENASCHLAIGKAYPHCLDGGVKMSEKELEAHGVNKSLVHVDFMIGSAELDIDGITESGEVQPVFRSGNWAF